MSDTRSKIATGAAWMVGLKLLERFLGLLSTVILARLLVPADFGLVAMAMSIIAILDLLGSFGIDMMLIQKQDAKRELYDTAWTITALYGCVAAVVLCLLAAPGAAFYSDPRLEEIMYVLAIATAVQGFDNIGVVAFRKELAMDREFRFMLGKKLITVTATIVAAWLMKSYWALVIGTVIGRILAMALSYAVHPYRPRFSLVGVREIYRFSGWLVLNNNLLFVVGRVSDFITGKVAGTHAMGIFTIANEIASLPTTELVAPINRAAFPGYARMADKPGELAASYADIFGMIAVIVLPASIGIALLAEQCVLLILGWRWTDAVEPMRWLAIAGALAALQTNGLYVHIAMGRPAVVTVLASIHACILIPGVLFGAQHSGVTGTAMAITGSALVMAPFYHGSVARALGLPYRNLAARLWRPMAASGLMALVVSGVAGMLSKPATNAGIVFDIIVLASIGAVTYVAGVLALWRLAGTPPSAERYLLDRASALMVKFMDRRTC